MPFGISNKNLNWVETRNSLVQVLLPTFFFSFERNIRDIHKLGPGGSISRDIPDGADLEAADLLPSGLDFNIGIQGIPLAPFNVGIQADTTISYSVGDFYPI